MLTSGLKTSLFVLLWMGLSPGLFLPSTSMAQGLVWNLPEPGTAVRYTGDYRQVTRRPQSQEGDLSLQWRRTLEIRYLSKETASYRGEEVPCAWLEYEVVTGQQVDGNLESGPGGTRIYKVLVPESHISGLEFFRTKIPQAYVPIVQGYQKIGEDEAEPMEQPVLQVFPVLTQIFLNEELSVSGEETVSVTAGEYECQIIQCETSFENAESRTTNQTRLWGSEGIPFGPVRWNVRIDREVKTAADPRDQFKQHSEITVEMQATEILNNATSKLSTP